MYYATTVRCIVVLFVDFTHAVFIIIVICSAVILASFYCFFTNIYMFYSNLYVHLYQNTEHVTFFKPRSQNLHHIKPCKIFM